MPQTAETAERDRESGRKPHPFRGQNLVGRPCFFAGDATTADIGVERNERGPVHKKTSLLVQVDGPDADVAVDLSEQAAVELAARLLAAASA
jgi:hypothetical protein